MPTPISGKNGSVKYNNVTVLDVTQWSISLDVVTTRYASSASAGAKVTIPGVVSGAGSIQFKFNPSGSTGTVQEGQSYTMELHIDTSATYLSFTAVIKNVKLTVDIDNGTVVTGSADFETSGAITRTGF